LKQIWRDRRLEKTAGRLRRRQERNRAHLSFVLLGVFALLTITLAAWVNLHRGLPLIP
jgi:hypothetical protein